MTMLRFPIIHDTCKCTIQSESIIKQGVEHRRCIEHGIVKLVPFYELKEDIITKEKNLHLYWGCLLCFQKALGQIHEINTECCLLCNQTNNLDDCTICAAPVCKAHSIEHVCMACINEGRQAD